MLISVIYVGAPDCPFSGKSVGLITVNAGVKEAQRAILSKSPSRHCMVRNTVHVMIGVQEVRECISTIVESLTLTE